MSSTQESVPVYVPTAEGEVIQQAYVINSAIPQVVVNTEVTNDMVKTFSLARTVKFLATIDMFFSFIYCFYKNLTTK